jgi:hypothetical protein
MLFLKNLLIFAILAILLISFDLDGVFGYPSKAGKLNNGKKIGKNSSAKKSASKSNSGNSEKIIYGIKKLPPRDVLMKIKARRLLKLKTEH